MELWDVYNRDRTKANKTMIRGNAFESKNRSSPPCAKGGGVLRSKTRGIVCTHCRFVIHSK